MQQQQQEPTTTAALTKRHQHKTTTSHPTDSDLELFKLYQKTKVLDEDGKLIKSDLKMRNDLAQRNAKLVTFVVNKFYNKRQKHKELRADLLQEGHLGLFDAIDGFKPELGFKFSTYATWWIRQSVNSFLLDDEPVLHVPSHVRTARNKVYNFTKDRGITINDISPAMLKELGMTEKMLTSVSAANKAKSWQIDSLEAPLSASVDNKTLKDLLPSDSLELGLVMDNKRIVSAARTVLRSLGIREQHVLLERYGIDSTNLPPAEDLATKEAK